MAEWDYLNLSIQHQLGSIMRWQSKPNCSSLTMKPLFFKAGWNFITRVLSLSGHDSVSEFVAVLEKQINTRFFSSASQWKKPSQLAWLVFDSICFLCRWDPWLHEKAVGITNFSAFEVLALRKTPTQTLHPYSLSRSILLCLLIYRLSSHTFFAVPFSSRLLMSQSAQLLSNANASFSS